MASLSKQTRTLPSGASQTRYRVSYKDLNGKWRSKFFRTRKEAQKFRDEVTLKVERREFLPDAGHLSLEQIGKLYIEECKTNGLQEITHRDYEGVLRNHIYPEFAHRDPNTFTTPELKRFFQDLKRGGLSPARLTKIKVVFGALLAFAVEEEYTATNPVKDIRLRFPQTIKGVEDEEVVIPSMEDLKKILDRGNLSLRDHTMVTLAAMCGTRVSETMGLSWKHVDFSNGELLIRQRMDRLKKLGPPKTKNSRRNIPIPVPALELLRAWQKECPQAIHDLVFPTTAGTPLDRSNWDKRVWTSHLFSKGLAKIDHSTKKVHKKYLFRHLRHAYASLMIKQGANPKEIMQYMGHSTINVTYDLYGNLFPDDGSYKQAVNQAMGGLLGTKLVQS
ncbi:site-specific integrase [Luteithermobacter gelatinilyticus]|uniref:site-specific integrase n=1 Tax=Luteithermobacter gelatinilyticus TaxID=2582913 RepID=UPI001106949A|nr:site-specific integrase [Luteithermobacter gelatinilyticus]